MVREDETNPAIPVDSVRRRRVSSMSQLDTAAILQGALELHAGNPERQMEAIREAMSRAREQGRLLALTDQSGTQEDFAREHAARRALEHRLSDARAAFLRWEREQDPGGLVELRALLMKRGT